MGVLQNVIGEIGDIVNRLSVSSKEKQKIQEEIQSLVYRYKSELVREQAAAVGEETRGNWLQRSWRPIVMLAFALVILSGMFMESTLLSDNSRLWDLLEIGLGGYVIGRSGEKVTESLLSRKWK
ncbi:holin family protein [Butyricimonas paravirosa]|uniref:holin family protein n=1 Tax=Butyricimonas paravirosa TaxID=1472417 RepID=UPI00210A9ABB|nr:holin family protein [Butyricimonas paravirosa]MCQ4875184.1 holin family protein [Butyricimonas paravirosa]